MKWLLRIIEVLTFSGDFLTEFADRDIVLKVEPVNFKLESSISCSGKVTYFQELWGCLERVEGDFFRGPVYAQVVTNFNHKLPVVGQIHF